MATTERLRFLLAEREAKPWRDELAGVLADLPDAPMVETPPASDAKIRAILAAWGAASGAEPERRTFTSASSVADHLATAAGQPGDQLWILPGPQPQVGVLTLVAPLQPALVSVLTTWNREGFVVLNPTRGDVLLVDLLGTDPFVVEVQARHARADRDAS